MAAAGQRPDEEQLVEGRGDVQAHPADAGDIDGGRRVAQPESVAGVGRAENRHRGGASQRERLGDTVMSLEENPAQTHFYQKVFYSMEGSAGGIGTSAGGGCG